MLPTDDDEYLVTARRQFSLTAGPSSTYSTFGPSSSGPLGGAGGKPSNNPFTGRNKSKIAKSTLSLFTCLQDPANISIFAHPTMDQVVAANSSKSGMNTPSTGGVKPWGLTRGQSAEKLDKLADQFLGTGETRRTLKDGCLSLHRDELLADWQNFCVDTVTETKIGAQKSMPILGRVVNKVGGDVKGVEVRSSAKGGKLVGTQSIRDYEVIGPKSYLELHTAKQQGTHSYKQTHHRN